MKAKTRIHKFLNRGHVLINALASRFVADSNLHEIAFTRTTRDPVTLTNFSRVMYVKKIAGKYLIRDYQIENCRHNARTVYDRTRITSNHKNAIRAINAALVTISEDPSVTDNRGYLAAIKVIKWADK